MFSLIYDRINVWANAGEAGDLSQEMIQATEFSTMGGPLGDPWIWAYPQHCIADPLWGKTTAYLIFLLFIVTPAKLMNKQNSCQ